MKEKKQRGGGREQLKKKMIIIMNIDYAVLVGGFPRQAGMERKQLMEKNSPIFKAMGEGLEKYAKKTCKVKHSTEHFVLVVANPVNTNALVCAHYAPKIPKKNFVALTRLDQNRGLAQLAEKLSVPVAHVRNVVIWGNHSSTQFLFYFLFAILVPDVSDAQVLTNGKYEKVKVDAQWVRGDFTKIVQQRGKAIIDARGMSSAMSAANAIKDCLRDWAQGTHEGEHVSMGVFTDGSYGITDELIFSFPCVCKNGDYHIVTVSFYLFFLCLELCPRFFICIGLKFYQGQKLDEETEKLLKATHKELLEEKVEAGLK
ncbi:malate dehydrogenase, cytosolic [Reticulomyxa filosa]|uniref:Malate dehydrogenase, cytosolic n=1 Tax=Reticulomyxa filosa TaxID=46433 RepID=X6NL59_RETFI|nr:malate dehydrogenase, cytosolic [Reticulomyxa filosa]|eukprot:ETO27020.1 malate dehydrogenase, cytosolic [Reticulomyxa filosa]